MSGSSPFQNDSQAAYGNHQDVYENMQKMKCDPFSETIGNQNRESIAQVRDPIIPDLDLSSFDPPDEKDFNALVLTPPPEFLEN